MTLLYALLPLFCATATEARGGKGKGGGIDSGGGSSIDLNLDPLDTATFVFLVLYAIATAGQLINALKMFKARQPGDDYPRRIAVVAFICLAASAIIAAYSLSSYTVSQFSPSASGDPVTVFLVGVMGSFTRILFSVFFYAAILLVLDWRCQQQAAQYGHALSKQFAIVVRIVPAVLLFIMLICGVARAGIGGDATVHVSAPWSAYSALYHVYLAMYILATLAIVGATIVLWTNRRPQNATYELLQFDDRVLSRILYIIVPCISIQALYGLIYDIIAFVPAIDASVDWSGVNLADILIQGTLNLIIIHVASTFGLPPKKKQNEPVRAEAKGMEASPLVTGSTYVNK